jgi:hypothetical protein
MTTTGINSRQGVVISLTARIGGPDAEAKKFTGRNAWTLSKLIAAGESGITALEIQGPRLSGYILRLRQAGVPIETRSERHAGNFSGQHGRYLLRAPVEIIAEVRA